MRLLVLTLLVAFLAFIESVHGAKKYLFKTCDQNSFCKRNRHYADQVVEKGFTSPYTLNPDSIKLSSGSLTGMVVKDVNGVKVELPMTLDIMQEGGVRVTLDEKKRQDGNVKYNGHESVRKERYSIADIAYDGELKVGTMTADKQDNLLNVKYDDSNSLEIQYSPLKLTFSRNGDKQVELNGRGFLNLEHAREKDTENHLLEIETDSGMWEDEFDNHKDVKVRGPEAIALDTVFLGYQHVYGIPEHADSMSLKETRGDGDGKHDDPYRLYNVDIFEYETNSEMPMYGSIPFMTAQKKDESAGVFWANAADTYVDITKDKQGTTSHWISENGLLDVFVFMADTPNEINRQYGAITGKSALPQEFAIGYNQCRWNYNSEDDVLEVHENFDKHGIPYDVIWLDIEYTEEKKYFTWNKALFPDPVRMLNKLDKTGRKLVAIVDPHIKNADNYDIVKTIKNELIGIKNSKGELFYGHCWPGESVWIDTMNPAAQKYWDKWFKELAAGSTNLHIWNDMNEPSVFSGTETSMFKDGIHYGGWEHRDVHNIWGLTFHNSTVEAMKKRYGNKQRPLVLTRAYFAGSQRVGPMWTGDNMAKWEYLQAATPMVLTSGIAGMPFAGSDVGGFFGDPSDELLARWYQTGAFHPFFRAHAHIDSKRREPYIADYPYNTTARDAIQLRYKLLPSLYTAFYKASINLSPILKPMHYVVPSNELTYNIDDQFFFGDTGILVKPIVHEGVTKTDVYLPDNEVYYDYDTFKPYNGMKSHSIKTPLSKIPMFMRGGYIHTRRDRNRRSVELKKYDPYTLVIAVDKSGQASGELYVDDGVSYNYQNGEYLVRKFDFNKNVLKSQGIYSKKSFGKTRVEKVILVGSGLKSTTATVTQGSNTWTVDVLEQGESLVVRDPRVVIGSDFSIKLD